MDHVASNGAITPCMLERFGRCRICELIDRDGPHYRESYRRLFHPEEFPPAFDRNDEARTTNDEGSTKHEAPAPFGPNDEARMTNDEGMPLSSFVLRDSDFRPEAAKGRPPGLLTKAANVARAVIDHAVAGFPEASEETVRARLAICRSCPDLVAAARSCNRCGCKMDVKVYWSEQRCPAGKW
jgi:hypothetical protein